jgi:hypothetical protein
MKMKTIETAFVEEGYVNIPFSFNGAGHPKPLLVSSLKLTAPLQFE